MIRESEIQGERNTGFEKENGRGEFECGNCHYYRELSNSTGSCGQKDMMEFSQEPKMSDGRILVHEEDCCEYVDRIGIIELFPDFK